MWEVTKHHLLLHWCQAIWLSQIARLELKTDVSEINVTENRKLGWRYWEFLWSLSCIWWGGTLGDTGGVKQKDLPNIHYCDNFCSPVKDSSPHPGALHLRPLALLKALEPPNCAELSALFCNRWNLFYKMKILRLNLSGKWGISIRMSMTSYPLTPLANTSACWFKTSSTFSWNIMDINRQINFKKYLEKW